MLWDRSPLSRIRDVRIPVLVAHGGRDPRVRRDEAERVVAALRAGGVPHEYLLFEDEGHGFVKPRNGLAFYTAAERFLEPPAARLTGPGSAHGDGLGGASRQRDLMEPHRPGAGGVRAALPEEEVLADGAVPVHAARGIDQGRGARVRDPGGLVRRALVGEQPDHL
jgi:hypothetical protein